MNCPCAPCVRGVKTQIDEPVEEISHKLSLIRPFRPVWDRSHWMHAAAFHRGYRFSVTLLQANACPLESAEIRGIQTQRQIITQFKLFALSHSTFRSLLSHTLSFFQKIVVKSIRQTVPAEGMINDAGVKCTVHSQWGRCAAYVMVHTKWPCTKLSHSVDRVGWKAKMASVVFWIPWHGHCPSNFLSSSLVLNFFTSESSSDFFFTVWYWQIVKPIHEPWKTTWRVQTKMVDRLCRRVYTWWKVASSGKSPELCPLRERYVAHRCKPMCVHQSHINTTCDVISCKALAQCFFLRCSMHFQEMKMLQLRSARLHIDVPRILCPMHCSSKFNFLLLQPNQQMNHNSRFSSTQVTACTQKMWEYDWSQKRILTPQAYWSL